MSARGMICPWCGLSFAPRRASKDGRNPGRKQEYCCPQCKTEMHGAARAWAIAQVKAGKLSVDELRTFRQTRTFKKRRSEAEPNPAAAAGPPA